MGGMTKAVEAGAQAADRRTAARSRRASTGARKLSWASTNTRAETRQVDMLDIDNTAVRDRQIRA